MNNQTDQEQRSPSQSEIDAANKLLRELRELEIDLTNADRERNDAAMAGENQ